MTSITALSTSSSSSTYQTHRIRDGKDPMAAVADKLGLSKDDLKSKLKSGSSLDDIATEQGISHDDLIAAIKSGMSSGGSSGTSDADQTAMAEKIATTKGMPKHPGGHGPGGPGGPGGPKGQNSGLQDSGKLDEISKLLDSDSGEVSSTTSASDLVKKLQSKGVDLSQLRNVLNSGDLLDVSA